MCIRDRPNVLRQCLTLIAVFPMLSVYGYQAYNHYIMGKSLYIHNPSKKLSTAENILRMLRPDKKYTQMEAVVLDLALVLHMEHGGGNNSTFTTHVAVSYTHLDVYKRQGMRWAITKDEKEKYRESLKVLGLGLENRMTSKVGLLSGGQRQALTLLMATLRQPDLLLLDEHTAALDPKTAAKVLEITEQIVAENHLTTIMITHNMKDAIRMGNRLVMMHDGRIIYDVSGEEKKNLRVSQLLEKFEQAAGEEFANDRMMLN